MSDSTHSRACWGVMPQLVGQADRTSTKEKPLPLIWFSKAIKKAFENQINGKGFSFVEVLSACPTNWGMTPLQALEWVESDMMPYYPLGVYRDKTAAKEAAK